MTEIDRIYSMHTLVRQFVSVVKMIDLYGLNIIIFSMPTRVPASCMDSRLELLCLLYDSTY